MRCFYSSKDTVTLLQRDLLLTDYICGNPIPNDLPFAGSRKDTDQRGDLPVESPH